MRTGRLHVALAGGDIGDGDVAACHVIRGEDRSIRTATLFGRGATSTIEVPPGVYLVRATLASGQTLTGTAHVTSDEDIHVELQRRELIGRRLIDDAGGPPLAERSGRETRLWAQRWDIRSGGQDPRPLLAQSITQQPGLITIDLETEPGRDCVQIGGPQVAWRVIQLPPAYAARIIISVPEADGGFHDGARVDAYGSSPIARSMLGYLTSGDLDSARVLARELLHLADGLANNALGGEVTAVAAFYQLRIGHDDGTAAQLADLPAMFPDLPDAWVIHAWQRLRRPSVPERDEARASLVRATQTGVPVYTEGLRLLFEGLRAFAADDPHDAEICTLLDSVQEYAAACDWSAAYTTYWARRPDQPTLHKQVGYPPQSDEDWTPLALHGPATLTLAAAAVPASDPEEPLGGMMTTAAIMTDGDADDSSTRLIDLVDDLWPMSDPVVRQRMVALLPPDVADEIHRSQGAVTTESIITAARRVESGLGQLMAILRQLESRSETMTALEKFLDARTDLRSATTVPRPTSVDSGYPGAAATSSGDDPEVGAEVPSVWGGVPPRYGGFIGRHNALLRIHDELHEPRSDRGATVCTLLGVPGVGKTTLAVEFAYTYAPEYEVVWWVHAEEPWLIRRSLASLAQRIGVPQSEDIEQTVANLLRESETNDQLKHSLLVFDGADRISEVRPYLPRSGHVLLTTRNEEGGVVSRPLEVELFSDRESNDLLRGRGLNLNEREAAMLANRLGHLPLALDQAAAWQVTTEMTARDYLHQLDLLGARTADEVEKGTSVRAAYQIALEGLRSDEGAAAELLLLCAFLTSQPISIPMLLRGGKADLSPVLTNIMRDDRNLRRAVREIGRSGLAVIDVRRGTLKLHELVQAELRDLLPPARRTEMETAALRVLAWANPGAPDQPESWPLHAQIAPHITAAVQTSTEPEVRRLVMDQIRYLYSIGDYAGSRDLAERAIDAWDHAFGRDDRMALVARHHLARALRLVGETARARTLNQQTLARMRVVLGDNDEQTLWTANGVGSDLRLEGKFAKARDLDEDNHGRHVKRFGEDDQATLTAASNLAADLRLLGRFAQARVLDEDIVFRRAQTFGELHPYTLRSYINLVRDLYGIGRYRAALELQRRVHERVLPANHSDLLVASRTLAMTLRKMGYLDEAHAMAERTYAASYKRFGADHEHTLAACTTLSNTLRTAGDLPRARELADDALTRYAKTLTNAHPFTMCCRANLATILRLSGELDAARELDERALAELGAELGRDHIFALSCAAGLANDEAAQGDHHAALNRLHDIVQRSRRVRPAHHPHTLACEANLALELRVCDRPDDADALLPLIIELMRERLGPDHPDVQAVTDSRRIEPDIEPPSIWT